MNDKKIIPFLWIDESVTQSAVETEIEKIAECGIQAFCVESRIFSDFCGEKWWTILKFILDKAKRAGMKVWILDDKRYPSGFANGALERGHKNAAQKHLFVRRTDAVGPEDDVRFLVRSASEDGDEFIGAFLAPKCGGLPVIDEALDVSDRFDGTYIECSLNGGEYTLISLFSSTKYSEVPLQADTTSEEGAKLIIDEVYEKHYQRLGEYFGDVLAGFFSDEPRIGNGFSDVRINKFNVYDFRLGMEGMSFPWSEKLAGRLEKRGVILRDILALWYDGKYRARTRFVYMDELSKAYSENFVGRISDWCHNHGVLYAGHVIEENGNHARSGSGTAHYFRSMKGADYSAIDIVLHQLKPYCNDEPFRSAIEGGYSDPRFFNVFLPMLAASDAALDCNKKGRALCEIFGAFGWGESVDDMRWMVNTMIAGGINLFIPHAFSAIHPNSDCPPHFYSGGEYAGFYGFKELMKYTDSLCRRFSDGTRFAEVAVVYNAEADWSGEKYVAPEKICYELSRRQIAFDVVPADILARGRACDGKLDVSGRKYRAVICASCEGYPKELDEIFAKIKQIVPFFAVDESSLSKTVNTLKRSEISPIKTFGYYPNVKTLVYDKAGKISAFIFNSGKNKITVSIKTNAERLYASDALDKTQLANAENGELKIELEGGAAVVLSDEKGTVKPEAEEAGAPDAIKNYVCLPLQKPMQIKNGLISDINRVDGMKSFSGKLISSFYIGDADGIKIDYNGEYCKVVAGDREEVSISKPFVMFFDKRYGGKIVVETANTFANAKRDELSRFSTIEKAGFTDIRLLNKKV